MEESYLLQTLEKVTKQRNVMLIAGGGLLAANLLLAVAVTSTQREIILVPGIERQYRLKGSDISISYIEEWSRMTLVGLLDLTPTNVVHKKSMVLKHTLAGSMAEISQYFADKSQQHKAFELSTYFTETKPLEINAQDLTVRAIGVLTIGYGKKQWEEREAEYLLEFTMQSGRLKLKKFTEKIKLQLTNKQEEIAEKIEQTE